MSKANNYLRVIETAVANGQITLRPGGVNVLHVYHDDWCNSFKGMPCNCNPNVVIKIVPKSGQKGGSG